jgi:hypothetical protein
MEEKPASINRVVRSVLKSREFPELPLQRD